MTAVVGTVLFIGVLVFLPIIAFVAATRAAAPLLEPRLGPLMGWVWIYHAGVSNAWGAIVIARRAFAPREPQIRIAPLGDLIGEGNENTFLQLKIFGRATVDG